MEEMELNELIIDLLTNNRESQTKVDEIPTKHAKMELSTM
jgi:hypothetical protein